MLAAGDPYGEVGAAILAKELLREVYTARNLAHARRRLIVLFQQCADAQMAELIRLARTIDRWQTEVLAHHHTGRASEGCVKTSTCSPRRSAATSTGSPTMTSNAGVSSDASAPNRLPSPSADSGPVNHAQSRRTLNQQRMSTIVEASQLLRLPQRLNRQRSLSRKYCRTRVGVDEIYEQPRLHSRRITSSNSSPREAAPAGQRFFRRLRRTEHGRMSR